jgi:ribonuclease R
MEVTPRGKVERYEIRESVIRSAQRFTYEEAQELLDQRERRHPLAARVRMAAELARTLLKKRLREGSVDFDLPEVRVVLDETGIVTDVRRKDRKESNRLIEEFMLLANRTVAQEIQRRRNPPPFVYRVHDRPDEERIQKLAEYVRAFGYSLQLKGGNVQSRDLNALLDHVKGAPEEPVIEEAALRAMAKARYQVENIGHYGLAFSHYAHFTSPIRRYPDLIAHRLLKRYLSGGPPVDAEDLQAQCVHCSEREKAATEAERESVRLKQVEYMQQHVGERFDGVVSGVTKFGVFVELERVLVEGLVHVRNLDDDYYEYDDRSYRLVGQHTGRTYRLGDKVRVLVAGANVETREIDLEFVD